MFILYLNVFINSDLIENCLAENSYDAGSDVMGLGGVLTDELRTGTGVQTVPGVDGPDVQTASLGPQCMQNVCETVEDIEERWCLAGAAALLFDKVSLEFQIL